MLRILDDDFNIVETVPKCKSVTWVSRFTESGSFTVVLPNKKYDHIKRGNFVRYGDRYGIIEYISKNDDSLTVRGYDLKAVTLYRIADKKAYSGKAETVIKNIMSDNTSGTRNYKNLTVAATQGRGNDIEYDITSLDSVENHFKKICEDNEIGYDITVSGANLLFDICIPQYRDIVYSLRRKNISDYEYLLDALSQRNVAVCETKSEGFDFVETTKNGSRFLTKLKGGTIYFKDGARFEIADDIENIINAPSIPNIYAAYNLTTKTMSIEYGSSKSDTDTVYYILLGEVIFSDGAFKEYKKAEFPQYTVFYYNDETEPNGFGRKEKVGDCEKWAESLEKITEAATAELFSADDYKSEWFLGDFVTIKIEIFGETISFTRQITEVSESFTASEIKVTPTFGEPKENIIRKLIKGRL